MRLSRSGWVPLVVLAGVLLVRCSENATAPSKATERALPTESDGVGGVHATLASYPADDRGLGSPVGAGFPEVGELALPNAVFRTRPAADARGIITGEAPLDVTFNTCRTTDPDPDDQIKGVFDFDGDGKIDLSGPCRANNTYSRTTCSRAIICVTDRTPDGKICTNYDVCPFSAATGPSACEPLSASVSSTLTPADAPQTDRIFRDGVASTCAGKAYPGDFVTGPQVYKSFSYQNSGTSPACMRVNFDPSSGATPCGATAHAVAYLNSYNPASKATNYLGDVGSSATQPFSFTVPGSSTFLVVVNSNFGPTTCTFSFSVQNTSC